MLLYNIGTSGGGAYPTQQSVIPSQPQAFYPGQNQAYPGLADGPPLSYPGECYPECVNLRAFYICTRDSDKICITYFTVKSLQLLNS